MGDIDTTRTLVGARSAASGRRRVRRAALVVGAVAVTLVVAAAVGLRAWADEQYRASDDRLVPPASRIAAAEAADAAWPFSDAYRARVATLRGLALFEGGDILGAYDVLHAEYVREAIAGRFDPQLAAAHALVYGEYWAWSSRAAHVMHGKEQPDGTIRPEDVQHFPGAPGK
jgi:hypothetical protein